MFEESKETSVWWQKVPIYSAKGMFWWQEMSRKHEASKAPNEYVAIQTSNS